MRRAVTIEILAQAACNPLGSLIAGRGEARRTHEAASQLGSNLNRGILGIVQQGQYEALRTEGFEPIGRGDVPGFAPRASSRARDLSRR
jgi:hypothetical protein